MFHQDNVNDIRIDSNGIEHLNDDPAKSDVLYERYKNKITKALNNESKDDLFDLYDKNKKFSHDLVKYIRVKLAQRNEQILDKRYNYITFNTLGYEYLDGCFKPKDHSQNLIEMLACYK